MELSRPGDLWKKPLDASHHLLFRCTSGCLWITACDGHDHVLKAGESLELSGPGLVVAETLNVPCAEFHCLEVLAA